MLTKIAALAFRGLTRNTLPLYNARALIQKRPAYFFTSSSDPTQTALLQQVQAKVFQVLQTAAKCKKEKLSRSATFEQLGFDSLDSVQLVVAMQQYFGFDIPNEEAQKIANVEAAINTFYRHLNAQIANKLVEGSNSEVDKNKK